MSIGNLSDIAWLEIHGGICGEFRAEMIWRLIKTKQKVIFA